MLCFALPVRILRTEDFNNVKRGKSLVVVIGSCGFFFFLFLSSRSPCDFLQRSDWKNHQTCGSSARSQESVEVSVYALLSYLKGHRHIGFIVISWHTDTIITPRLPSNNNNKKTSGGESQWRLVLPLWQINAWLYLMREQIRCFHPGAKLCILNGVLVHNRQHCTKHECSPFFSVQKPQT